MSQQFPTTPPLSSVSSPLISSGLSTKICHPETCWPMIIYLVLSIPAIISSFAIPNASIEAKISGAVGSSVWIAFWAFILWELCKHCHQKWAWFLLLLPFIIVIGVVIAIVIVIKTHNNDKNKNKNK